MGYRFIFLLMLLFGPATADSARAADSGAAVSAVASAIQAPAPALPQRGTLYRIRYQDQGHAHIGYLFGTIHIGRPDFFPLEPQATQALAEADTLMLELDMRDTASLQNAMKKYGLYEGNDTLDKHLSPASLARLKQALALAGIPFDDVAHMKGWIVADLLLITTLERQGYHTAQGTDMFLLGAAQAQGKTICGLETADFQFSLFDDMKEEEQEQYLNENLGDLESGAAVEKTQKLVDAWVTADEKAFDDLLKEAQNDDSVSGTFLRRVLLDRRNPAMADKIEALLKHDKASFIGIGLLHLLGSDGVPQLLARRGIEVTRLY